MSHGHGPANRGRRVLAMAAPLFVREPDGEPRGGAVVLHDVFGVTEYAEEVCRALARTGRLAVSPYLYYQRGGPAFDAGELGAARGHMAELTADDLTADIDAALSYLRARTTGPVLVVGFSMGAHLATWAAARHELAAAVAVSPSGVGSSPWPGVPPTELLVAERRTPWLGVVGGADARVDAGLLEMAARLPGPAAAVEVIAGAAHGFYRGGHPEHDPDAAAEARRRIGCFLDTKPLPSSIDH
ncbi:dienelactone hydrolase family protein [Actinoallomurus sp. NPDC052308]|uniref:dienelactone hydrolase family protein n=1 Tax=Actinoallomurus sp. NPDC052308 TaxID=3155530 RepID=UPI00342572DC